MGCVCSQDDANIEYKNEFYKINKEAEEKIKNNIHLLNLIIRLQSKIKGRVFRKKLKKELNSEEDEQLNYKSVNTSKIDPDELEELFKTYPPLNDGVEVEVRSPAQFNNKAIYLGEWDIKNNLRHGRGIQVWMSGAKYYGCWKGGKAYGKGKLIHSDGDEYDGDWENDKPSGYGVYIHSDKTKYEGEYFEGKKQGYGVFKWADGSVYSGQFLDNNIHGKGKYEFADGRKYDGDWKDNKLEGKGVFIWADGRKYTGDYKNDKKEGYGIFEWPDGKIYRGEWKNGKQHGQGEYYDPDEDIWKKGVWDYGKRRAFDS